MGKASAVLGSLLKIKPDSFINS
ncbi:hypothetical protein KHA80_19550 [Anaerobacillus sp. HL2]|nr:hypothetical protein KHA80_19550 [Anaerobacillus sp. HL2]